MLVKSLSKLNLVSKFSLNVFLFVLYSHLPVILLQRWIMHTFHLIFIGQFESYCGLFYKTKNWLMLPVTSQGLLKLTYFTTSRSSLYKTENQGPKITKVFKINPCGALGDTVSIIHMFTKTVFACSLGLCRKCRFSVFAFVQRYYVI